MCAIDERVLEAICKDLNKEEQRAVRKILNSFKHLINTGGEILTYTNITQHEIRTTTDKPIYTKLYRYPQVHERQICKQIDWMLE